MGNPSSGAVLFNLAGGAVLLTLFGYVGHQFLHEDQATQCASRYPAGRQLAFDDHAGNLLTPIELQGRAGSREWGLLKNARIVSAPGSPSRASMAVNLAVATNADSTSRSGVGFTWQAFDLSKATSACLTYSVFMPEKMTFGASGHLPGIFSSVSGANPDSAAVNSGFEARVGWNDPGDAGIDLRTGSEETWHAPEYAKAWPKGRWVPVEQEVVLNTPGTENGILRLWVDGKLHVDDRAVDFRKDAAVRLTGVVADIGYNGKSGPPGSLNVSPFVLQWQ